MYAQLKGAVRGAVKYYLAENHSTKKPLADMGVPPPPTPRAENAKINVTDEPYFGTQIVCNYLPFSKAAKGAQGGPQQYATFERKHSPTEK